MNRIDDSDFLLHYSVKSQKCIKLKSTKEVCERIKNIDNVRSQAERNECA
jgi:hypothetical protein